MKTRRVVEVEPAQFSAERLRQFEEWIADDQFEMLIERLLSEARRCTASYLATVLAPSQPDDVALAKSQLDRARTLMDMIDILCEIREHPSEFFNVKQTGANTAIRVE